MINQNPNKYFTGKVFLLMIIFFHFLQGFLYSQDKTKDTIKYPPFDRNKIKDAYLLDSKSDTISYQEFIWNDKRTISEVMNELPGFYVIDFGIASRNLIYCDNNADTRMGFFKDGLPVNDIYFGGMDVENFSINEISKIEEVSGASSFLYGLNSYGKSINIISKDEFISKTFCQLRYSQDRYNTLNADINFVIPISEKFNFSIGVNNNGNEGMYRDTSNIWRGRMRLNYYVSPKLNLKINFNYAQIERTLTEGLIYSSLDTLTDPIKAQIINNNSYEKIRNYFYDFDLTGKFFNSDKSLTKFKLYSINSVRLYRDDQSGPNPHPYSLAYDFRSIQYGIDLKQNFYVQINNYNAIDFLAGYNGYFNFLDNSIKGISENNCQSLLSKIDIISRNLTISTFGRYNHSDDNYFNYGFETKYNVYKTEDIEFGFKGGINKTAVPINFAVNNSGKIDNRYIELGPLFRLGNFNFALNYYNNQKKVTGTENDNGINFSSDYKSKYFDYYISLDKFDALYFPDYSMKFDFSYHNFFFNNKLNLRVGFNGKYENNLVPMNYSQIFYLPYGNPGYKVDYFNLDFYIGARIGSANINFTLGNIFNRFNYLAYIYPLIDRGGAFQVISRFTIVWDFLN